MQSTLTYRLMVAAASVAFFFSAPSVTPFCNAIASRFKSACTPRMLRSN
jgi:hypothetical protein